MSKLRNLHSPLKIGVSGCLLGRRVRYDTGHKKNQYITDTLAKYVRFIPVCPEVEAGLGVPREKCRLEGDASAPRIVGIESGLDRTAKIIRFSQAQTRKLQNLNISGFIFKRNSPSCGLKGVKVYSKRAPVRSGRGLYAGALIKRIPLLPVEEEGSLHDPGIRENFIIRISAYRRLQNLFRNRFSREALKDFHSAHKYFLMAHSPTHLRQLNRLVAAVKKYKPSELRDRYSVLFMETLRFRSTLRKNVNTLNHILGVLKSRLTAFERQYIIESIENYSRGLSPLIVPVTLVRHYAQKDDVEQVKNQIYLNPSHTELMLLYSVL